MLTLGFDCAILEKNTGVQNNSLNKLKGKIKISIWFFVTFAYLLLIS